MSQDLVSIITPAYASAKVIGQTISSVINQTHSNWEMLIADDCSPDETREVVSKWTQVEKRIHLIAMSENGGPALARNAALARAKGSWVAFLDSDDLWLPKKIENSIRFAEERMAPLVYTGYRRIVETGENPGRYLGVPTSLNYRQLLGNTAIATSTVLIDRRQVGDFRMTRTYYDDFDCWLRILKTGRTAYGLNEDLMRYRVMRGSVSSNKIRSARMVWANYREQQKIGVVLSVWYFSKYIIRAINKHRRW
jgi:teichuronic acid biosynthesis glycosyltransferase TuaG